MYVPCKLHRLRLNFPRPAPGGTQPAWPLGTTRGGLTTTCAKHGQSASKSSARVCAISLPLAGICIFYYRQGPRRFWDTEGGVSRPTAGVGFLFVSPRCRQKPKVSCAGLVARGGQSPDGNRQRQARQAVATKSPAGPGPECLNRHTRWPVHRIGRRGCPTNKPPCLPSTPIGLTVRQPPGTSRFQ